MKYRFSQISRLKRAEKLALNLLRGPAVSRAPAEVVAAFRAFGGQLVEEGGVIQNADAPTVNEDEFRALGLLAALQRDRASAIVDVQTPLAEAARHCAGLLDAMGYRLEYRLVSYLQAAPDDAPGQGAVPFADANSAVSAKAAARRSILEVVARDGVIHTVDLRKMGVPQETLRKLVRQRSLRRIARGAYAPNILQS